MKTLLILGLVFGSATVLAKDTAEEIRTSAASLERTAPSNSSIPRAFSRKIFEIDVTAALFNYTESTPTLRGAKEINVFKKTSNGTVLIVTDTGIGSGVLITDNGHIITNEHVVGDNSQVTVFFKPHGNKYNRDTLKPIQGIVEKTSITKDLALLKIEQIPSYAKPIVMPNILYPEVGADAHAIGHPNQELWTYTRGYVSHVREEYKWLINFNRSATVIQTQTPINPGSSGGPLLDEDGYLIGINSFFDSKSPNITYAVSAASIEQFLKTNKVDLDTENKQLKRAKKEKADKSASSAKCGAFIVQKVEAQSTDLGKFVRHDYDPKCIGRITLSLSYPEDQEKPMVISVEHDLYEGVIGFLLLDNDRDKQVDYTLVDDDGDGEWDLEGSNKLGEIIAGTLKPLP